MSQLGVSSRDRLRTALEHREPDCIPLDFGSTSVTGLHVSCVAALRVFDAIHNLQAGTPVESIVAMPDAVHEFNGGLHARSG